MNRFVTLAFTLALTLAGATPAAPTPKYSRYLHGESVPFKITTTAKSGFAVIGQFEGTYQVHPEFIDVTFTNASIQLIGSPSNQRVRLVTDIKFGLAQGLEGAKWEPLMMLPLATPDKVMHVGETLSLNTRAVRIPISEGLDLSKRWFLVEITNTFVDQGKPDATKFGYCYAHSSRNVFAAAR
jgi:hypothetical protein